MADGAPRRFLAPPPAGPVVPPPVEPTFSVIVAAYQAAAFIGDAVESVLAQTRQPLELIVCDDGSTDDLARALAPYRHRLRLIRKENGGEATAKNTAARAARGEFVAILDADDVYRPERLEALAELIRQRPDLDIVTSDCLIVVDGRVIRRCFDGGYTFEVGDQRRGILERNFIGPGHMAVRREALLAVGGFDEQFRHATDWDCWVRMVFAGSRAGLVDEPLAEYRVRQTSLASDRARQFAAYVAVLEKAAGRTDLSREELAVLETSLDAQRRRLRLRQAEDALARHEPGARRLAAVVARDPAFGLRTRLRLAVAAALPGAAASRLAVRSGELAAGIRPR